jgi:ATP-binding cassette subfamily C protein LapB
MGQAKRLMIAQALINDPPVLLLDEPTAELDRETEVKLVHVLRDLARTKTIIVASHSPYLLSFCQGILVLNKGKLAGAGPATQILPKLGIQPAITTPHISAA